MKRVITSVTYDWKEDGAEDWKAALKQFGIFVYDSPACEGSDQYGYVLSNSELSDKEIEQYEEDSYS